jgi:hypothetical protein
VKENLKKITVTHLNSKYFSQKNIQHFEYSDCPSRQASTNVEFRSREFKMFLQLKNFTQNSEQPKPARHLLSLIAKPFQIMRPPNTVRWSSHEHANYSSSDLFIKAFASIRTPGPIVEDKPTDRR